MAVLQLEGEAAQLRQVAKLFANGDITLDDYRNIRTVMIDAFVAEADSGAASVDTQVPREGLVSVEVAVPAVAAAPRRTPVLPSTPEPESSLTLLAIVGAGAMLLIVAILAMGLPR